jgi:hypothetical protein
VQIANKISFTTNHEKNVLFFLTRQDEEDYLTNKKTGSIKKRSVHPMLKNTPISPAPMIAHTFGAPDAAGG